MLAYISAIKLNLQIPKEDFLFIYIFNILALTSQWKNEDKVV